MEAINVKDLHFKYDVEEIIKGVSFSIEKGSYTTIIGHNGSGKSTIAKLLVGLLEKDSGSIAINGLDLNLDNLFKIRDQIGIVFQNPDNQFIGATVRDDIVFGLENHQVAHDLMDPTIEKYAEKVNMTKYLNSEPTKLSGGQKQRVAIAGVLAMAPEILIFDESTSMLDPQGKKEIKELIMDIHKERNMTIISITHDIEEVAISDDVIVMYEGNIAMQGKPQDILVQKDKLIKLQLDIPFTLRLEEKLKEAGVKLPVYLQEEGLVDALCQLHSKK